MGWKNISYAVAFLSVFVGSISQILLKQSAQTEHKNFIRKFLNWRVILSYALFFGTTILNVFAYRGIELKAMPMIESTGILWVTVLAVFLLNEKPTKRAIFSILITFVGIAVFCM